MSAKDRSAMSPATGNGHPLPAVPLGGSGIEVSRLALGSWRTYDRISKEQGVLVMRAAMDAGITFLDDARYDDETGKAPISTGYSEVIFGELFRAAGWRRDQTVVSNKLWWEFWPQQSPAQELDSSLGRMGFDYVDLIYSEPPPAGPEGVQGGRPASAGLPFEDAIAMISSLIETGKARAWGTLNWPPELMEQAWQIADRSGLPGPVATQPPYSLIRREVVEDPAMVTLVADRHLAIVASYTLAGGLLTGKYARDKNAGRAAAMFDKPWVLDAAAAGSELAALGARLGRDPAHLAMAFALNNQSVAAVLFGATTPEQISSDVAAVAVAEELTAAEQAEIAAVGSDDG
jgi:aryl-alcohol dehydrogenase-like predicted oxidoreductase